MADETQTELARLKSALWYAVGKIVDEYSLHTNRNASPQFIGALTELVWLQIESVATDIESFAHHAGRSRVQTEDVLLLARKNEDLHDMLKNHIDLKAAEKELSKAKSRK